MKVWEQNFDEIQKLYERMRQPVLNLLKQKSAEDALPIIWAAIAELYFGTLFMIQTKISDQKTDTMLKELWEWIGNQKQNEIVQETMKAYRKNVK